MTIGDTRELARPLLRHRSVITLGTRACLVFSTILVCCASPSAPHHSHQSRDRSGEEIYQQWLQKGREITAQFPQDYKKKDSNISKKQFEVITATTKTERATLFSAILDRSLRARTDDWFGRSCVRMLFHDFADVGDKANLIRLLAAYPLGRLGVHRRTEYTLITSPSFTDGITVLFEAYQTACSEEGRHDLLDIISRSFRWLNIDAKDEPAFVSQCDRWYQDHKDEIEPNPDYDYIDIGWNGSREIGKEDVVGLFRVRSGRQIDGED